MNYLFLDDLQNIQVWRPSRARPSNPPTIIGSSGLYSNGSLLLGRWATWWILCDYNIIRLDAVALPSTHNVQYVRSLPQRLPTEYSLAVWGVKLIQQTCHSKSQNSFPSGNQAFKSLWTNSSWMIYKTSKYGDQVELDHSTLLPSLEIRVRKHNGSLLRGRWTTWRILCDYNRIMLCLLPSHRLIKCSMCAVFLSGLPTEYSLAVRGGKLIQRN